MSGVVLLAITFVWLLPVDFSSTDSIWCCCCYILLHDTIIRLYWLSLKCQFTFRRFSIGCNNECHSTTCVRSFVLIYSHHTKISIWFAPTISIRFDSIYRIIVCCVSILQMQMQMLVIAMFRFWTTLSIYMYFVAGMWMWEKWTCDIIMLYAYCFSSSEWDLAYNLNALSYENSIVAAGTYVYIVRIHILICTYRLRFWKFWPILKL